MAVPSKDLMETYTSLHKYVYGKLPTPKNIEIMGSFSDGLVKGEIKRLEKLLGDPSPTRHNMGGIVSLNQMTQPIGYR